MTPCHSHNHWPSPKRQCENGPCVVVVVTSVGVICYPTSSEARRGSGPDVMATSVTCARWGWCQPRSPSLYQVAREGRAHEDSKKGWGSRRRHVEGGPREQGPWKGRRCTQGVAEPKRWIWRGHAGVQAGGMRCNAQGPRGRRGMEGARECH
ncbi:hypothetical protein BJV78DRAFT_1247083, partial [Lactifluus subvellereus]